MLEWSWSWVSYLLVANWLWANVDEAEPKPNSTNARLKEYEILSNDRRVAIDIFLKAVLLAAAFLAVAFKLLLDSKTVTDVVSRGAIGFVLIAFFLLVIFPCRQHDSALNASLNRVSNLLGIEPVISTKYIFDVVLGLASIVLVSWLVICGVLFLERGGF